MGKPKAIKIERMLPKKGTVAVQASKGKVLPVVYDGKLQRIVADKHMQIAIDRAPYETLIMLERALQAKDIVLTDMKKYLAEKKAKMDKPGSQKAAKENERAAVKGGK